MNILKRNYLFLLYHQRKYRKILEYISSTENIRDDDALFIRYEAYCSFFTKNYFHAQFSFEKLAEIDKASSEDYNTLAYLYARHNDKEKAINTWCLSLEKNKDNQASKNALDYIRDQGRSINLMEDEFFDSIAPKEPFLIPIKLIFYIILAIILFVLIFLLSYFGFNFVKEKINEYNFKNRKELKNIYLPDYNPNLLEKPKDNNSKYSYTEDGIKNKFENIKKNILKNKSVDAQIEINKIKLSNASASVKMKAEILESYIDEPDYASFKNKIIYADLLQEQQEYGIPFLYQNVYVTWPGRVVNHTIDKDRITFDLIIGNEKKGLIEALIPVVFTKAVTVENNEKVAVFGRIKVTEKNIYIDGKFLIKNLE